MKKTTKLGQALIQGLSEALDYERGKIDLRTTEVTLPDEPPKMSKTKIKKLRTQVLNVSQPVFARFLGVTPAAVKSWEIGNKSPSGSARRLMELIEHDSRIFSEIANKNKAG